MYFQKETLKDMLVSFRKNNEANGITGMMLFSEGIFLQVLEGEDRKVNTLVRKIRKDARHHSVVQLDEKAITRRIFPNWSMGFKVASAEEFKDLKGYANPADTGFLPTNDGELHPALAILEKFAENMRMK